MHNAIQISKLNDYVFSPKSLLYHSIYESFCEKVYHNTPQVEGKIAHENIDKARYSSSKRFLQGIPIYSSKYNLVGKIDILDLKTGTLIERKKLIKKIYEGYILQVYAQYFCLREMKFAVRKIKLHSLDDNKNYYLPLPDKNATISFKKILNSIKKYRPEKVKEEITPNKLNNCIYKIFYV